MLTKVGYDVKAVLGDFYVHEVDKKTDHDVHQFEALNQLMLIGFHKRKVAHDEDHCFEMVDQFEFTDFLMQHCDKLLALLSQLVKSVLFFEDTRLGLTATSAFDRGKTIRRVFC